MKYQNGSPPRHQFNRAAGKTHGHRPDRIFTEPSQRGVNGRQDDVAYNLGDVAVFGLGLHVIYALEITLTKA